MIFQVYYSLSGGWVGGRACQELGVWCADDANWTLLRNLLKAIVNVTKTIFENKMPKWKSKKKIH